MGLVAPRRSATRAPLRAALLASTAFLASAITAQAQSWTGAVSTDWFTAGNWNGGIPATNSSPTIDSTNPGGQGAIVNAATNALTQMNVGVNAQGLLTITAGVAKLDFFVFIIASIISRAGRFFIVAGLLYRYGAPIQDFIETRLKLVSVLFLVLVVGGVLMIKLV